MRFNMDFLRIMAAAQVDPLNNCWKGWNVYIVGCLSEGSVDLLEHLDIIGIKSKTIWNISSHSQSGSKWDLESTPRDTLLLSHNFPTSYQFSYKPDQQF
jgi:hypothetical protein